MILSVRDLSKHLIVNANTVARAYQELERLGALETRRGLGMAVTADGPKRCRERRREIVRDRVRDALREAAAAGLTTDDVHALVDEEWPQRAGRNGSSRAARN
jgi:GntR family transcriptional regulator